MAFQEPQSWEEMEKREDGSKPIKVNQGEVWQAKGRDRQAPPQNEVGPKMAFQKPHF
jgi:hypothetical protein